MLEVKQKLLNRKEFITTDTRTRNRILNKIEEVRNNNGVIKVELVHQGEDGKSKALPLALESNGTMKMFHLFDFFICITIVE